MTNREDIREVEWRETPTEGVHDLYVDGRIVEYDVPEDYRADALRRARVSEDEDDD